MKSYLKNGRSKEKAGGVVSIYLARTRPLVQTPVLFKKKRKLLYELEQLSFYLGLANVIPS
jgi:hypothetical protein